MVSTEFLSKILFPSLYGRNFSETKYIVNTQNNKVYIHKQSQRKPLYLRHKDQTERDDF